MKLHFGVPPTTKTDSFFNSLAGQLAQDARVGMADLRPLQMLELCSIFSESVSKQLDFSS